MAGQTWKYDSADIPEYYSSHARIAWKRGFSDRHYDVAYRSQPSNPYQQRHMRAAWEEGYVFAKAQET
jgi:ribosome modulation factor